MLSPNTGQPMRLVAGQPATYTLRGLPVEVAGPCYECDATGERFTTEEQDHQMLAQLHRRWREHHGLDRAALLARRQALGLTEAEAAALLGLRPGRYRAFEQTDRLPSKAVARLLRLLLSAQGVAALQEAAAALRPPASGPPPPQLPGSPAS